MERTFRKGLQRKEAQSRQGVPLEPRRAGLGLMSGRGGAGLLPQVGLLQFKFSLAELMFPQAIGR